MPHTSPYLLKVFELSLVCSQKSNYALLRTDAYRKSDVRTYTPYHSSVVLPYIQRDNNDLDF